MITITDGSTTIILNHVLWQNRDTDNSAGSDRRTFGGIVSQRLAGSWGSIILESILDGTTLRGWFTWAQVRQLKLWRDSAAKLTLNYAGDVRNVLIAIAGIVINPVIIRSTEPQDTDKCAGSLTLLQR